MVFIPIWQGILLIFSEIIVIFLSGFWSWQQKFCFLGPFEDLLPGNPSSAVPTSSHCLSSCSTRVQNVNFPLLTGINMSALPVWNVCALGKRQPECCFGADSIYPQLISPKYHLQPSQEESLSPICPSLHTRRRRGPLKPIDLSI